MDNFDTIKALGDLYKKLMPDTVYLVKNGERYDGIIAAIKDIMDFVITIDSDATFDVEKDELTGTHLSLVVRCALLAITEVDRFCDASRMADSIDVTPLTNGDLQICFGFKSAYIPVPSHK